MAQENVTQDGGSHGGESGQSIILLTFAFVALLLIVGLAIDLGMVYIERIRLSRACDAAALAAASELPNEEEAQKRAIEALAHNGYDLGNSVININDLPWANPPGAMVTIDINTLEYQAQGQLNTSDRIRVAGVSIVRLNIMQLIGIPEAPVTWRAVAENVNHLDIVLALDRSGSMQEDTICFGCYEPGSRIYPSGDRYPLRWRNPVNLEPWPEGPPPPCDEADPIVSGGHTTLVMEAEFYDHTNRLYYRELTELGDSYWALQRPSLDTSAQCDDRTCGSSSLDSTGNDQRGAFMMHMPHGDAGTYYRSGEIVDATPRLDYRVALPAGTYYVFVRAQGGSDLFVGEPDQGRDLARSVYWGMDGSYVGRTANYGDLLYGGYNEPVINSTAWRWARLSGQISLTQPATRTLNIWAGGLGFRLDKIILTTNYHSNPSDVGPDETHGRDPDGLACNPCNPGYGLVLGDPYNCDNRRDDLYDDDQPVRFLMEAAKDFIARLDPRVDQVGLVTYGIVDGDFRASIDIDLQCIVEKGDGCTDFDDVVEAVDDINADGGTNIPDAIRQGMEVFAGDNSRSAAAHILILMTDGQTNETDDLPSVCWAEDLWPQQPGESAEQRESRDCVVYYANQAKEAGYVIYTISLGEQADFDLLEYVAQETGAQHYNAARPEDLNDMFNAIADNIFLRLIE